MQIDNIFPIRGSQSENSQKLISQEGGPKLGTRRASAILEVAVNECQTMGVSPGEVTAALCEILANLSICNRWTDAQKAAFLPPAVGHAMSTGLPFSAPY